MTQATYKGYLLNALLVVLLRPNRRAGVFVLLVSIRREHFFLASPLLPLYSQCVLFFAQFILKVLNWHLICFFHSELTDKLMIKFHVQFTL